MTDVATPDRTTRRRAQTRRRLTRAGRELIAARGVAGLRIAELTDAADVGRGSFYNHFSSKTELVDAVVAETIDELAGAIMSGLRPDGDPAVEAALADRRFIRIAYDDPGVARLCVQLAHAETVFQEAVRPHARHSLDLGLATGRFRISDVEMTLTVLTSSAVAVIRSILSGQAAPDADAAHAELMLVCFGVEAGAAREIARRSIPAHARA